MTKTAGRTLAEALVLIAVVALFVAIGTWLFAHEERAREDSLASGPKSAESSLSSTALDEPSPIAVSRAAAVTTTEPQPPAPAAAPSSPQRHVEGRVLDIQGRPVEAARVTLAVPNPPELAWSGSDGSFRFETQADELHLVAEHPRWRTVRTQMWHADAPRPGIIVVAPCTSVSGQVVDQQGVGVAGAGISLQLPPTLLSKFPFALDTSVATPLSTETVDREGRFRLDDAICAPGTWLEARCEDYSPHSVKVPTDPNAFVRIVLEPDPRVSKRTIRGIVVRHGGEPATKAVVSFGKESVKTDDRGAFELPCRVVAMQPGWDSQPILWDWSDDSALVATEAGSQPAWVPEFGRVVNKSAADPPPQKLFLGPPPLSIRGHLLDAQRRPLAGYTVTLMDPTPVSAGMYPVRSLEERTGKGRVVTDADGAFEIGGLFERRYRLQAFSNRTFGRLESADIAAGTTDVELVFPPDAFVPEIAGRIEDRNGSPIEGARILLVVTTSRSINARGEASEGGSTRSEVATSGRDGSFRAEHVPRRGSELRVVAKDHSDPRVVVSELDCDRPIVIQLDRECRFRIEGLPSIQKEPAPIPGFPQKDHTLRLLALDARDNELRISRSENTEYGAGNQLVASEDSAEIYTVSEAAVGIVLYTADGTLLGRRPVRLVPGKLTVVTW